ncbi:MAG TPA: hypothetical protein DCY03_15990, partial [Planctomycetaceae bacterium]|nr:hypothetical protein [Planctomycetaceae bacterium]
MKLLWICEKNDIYDENTHTGFQMCPSPSPESVKKIKSVSIQTMIAFMIAGGFFALTYPALKQSREIARARANHRGNLRMLGMALSIYSNTSNQNLPMGGNTDLHST